MSTEPDFDELQANTAIQRAIPVCLNQLTNLPHIDRVPHWSDFGRPLEGSMAFVVGAGPSLNKNVEQLREFMATEPNAVVFAVNTSAPALKRAGVHIDVLLSVESVPVSTHMADCLDDTSLLALDLQCHPTAWELTKGRDAVWLLSHSPECLAICEPADVPPLRHGGAALTGAVQLAYEWGASNIVLLGADLSFPLEGAAYASGAGWDGLEAKGVDEDGKLVFEGREDRDEAHDSAGIARVPRQRTMFPLQGWGGGEVQTTGDFLWQVKCLEEFAQLLVLDNGVALINATEGGAWLQGWACVPLVEAVTRAGQGRPTITPWFGLPRYEHVRDTIVRQLDQACELWEAADRGVSLGGLAGLSDNSTIVETMLAPDMIMMRRRKDIPPATKARLAYQAIRVAAERCKGVLGE